MQYTSAEANKLLKQTEEELSQLIVNENQSKEFIMSLGEDIEDIRPEYNYEETTNKKKELYKKIRTIKHAINVFNSVTIIPEFNMTIDEMLIYLPQLSTRKNQLSSMASRLPKTRENNRYGSSSFIDYRIANYDIDTVKQDLEKVTTELYKAHLALDMVNTTVKFEINL